MLFFLVCFCVVTHHFNDRVVTEGVLTSQRLPLSPHSTASNDREIWSACRDIYSSQMRARKGGQSLREDVRRGDKWSQMGRCFTDSFTCCLMRHQLLNVIL